MPITLTEGAIDAISAYLQANLGTHIGEINEMYDNQPVALEMPQTFAWSDRNILPPLPAMLVIGDDLPSVHLEENRSGALDTWHDITIISVDVNPDQDVLRKMMYRHVAAVVRCLRAGERAAALPVFTWREPLAQYDSIYVDKDQQILFSDAQVRIRVLMQEVDDA